MSFENFKKYVAAIANENQDDIFSFEYKEKKYWLKRARPTKSKFYHKFYYKLFPFEILLPVDNKTGEEAVLFEVDKINKFKSLDINTPNVVLVTEEYFVLEDAGKAIHAYIREKDITEKELYFFVDKLVDILVEIHNKGQYHGGAQTRNFIYSKNTVYAIDFEDSFDESIDLEILQFRDLILLLLSFTKIKANIDFDYKYVIETYIEKSQNFNFKSRLKILYSKLSWLVYISEMNVVNKMIGKDVKNFFTFLRSIKDL